MRSQLVDVRAWGTRTSQTPGELDERRRRLWAAAEARAAGRGGIAAVVRETGISESTVRRGLTTFAGAFGSREEVDPVRHLIGIAAGWGRRG
jgi:hypothetical protein